MGTLPGESVWVSNNPVQLFQRGPGNRSPIESPPAAKKPLKSTSLSAGSSMPSAGVQFLQATAATAANVSAPGKENRSILKRMGAAGGPKSSRSWYGAGPGGSPTRKVNFELSVDVLVFDPVDGDYVCSESQRLNVEPTKDRREFVARTLLGRLNQRHGPAPKDRRPTAASSSTDGASTGRPLPPIASPTSSSPTSAYPPPDIDFSFYEDASGRLRIKFTVPLGPGVAAGDALVKANVAGNKVRVLGTRTLPSDDPRSSVPERQEFASRYSLPMDVDPYAITARMDGSGNLFVEAPVVTPAERRPAPAAAEKVTPRSSSSSSTLQPVAGARFA